MTIYKVRMFINNRPKRGRNKGTLTRVHYFEEVIIDNLESAKRIFEEQKIELKTLDYDNNTGRVELFIPHIFDSGILAYWPDNEEYIDKYEIPEG
jgi:hypothetical protein